VVEQFFFHRTSYVCSSFEKNYFLGVLAQVRMVTMLPYQSCTLKVDCVARYLGHLTNAYVAFDDPVN
jgi:hypothetical protein